MEAIRESWTDERMDDLSRKVDQGFERSDAAIERCDVAMRDLRRDMDQGFSRLRSEMNQGFERVDAEIRVLHVRFDALHRTLFLGATGVIASLIGLIATQI